MSPALPEVQMTGIVRGASLALLLAALIASVAAAPPSTQDARLPVPDPQTRAKAAKLIAELFQTDLMQIKNAADEAAYAAKLLKAATDTADDPAGRFELFEEARSSAAHAGDVETAMQAVGQISQAYRANGLGLAAQTLSVVVAHAGPRDAPRALPYIDNFVGQSVGADRFDLATLGTDLAMDAARKSQDPTLIAQAEAFAKETDSLKAAFEGVPAAGAKLAQNPSDADANLMIGRFYCLYKGEWGALLPLSHGSDPALKDLAAKDLAGATDPHAMMLIGDGWWDWAAVQSGMPRQNARGRAVFWYQKAAPQLQGLSKLVVEHRLFEFSAEHPESATPPHRE